MAELLAVGVGPAVRCGRGHSLHLAPTLTQNATPMQVKSNAVKPVSRDARASVARVTA